MTFSPAFIEQARREMIYATHGAKSHTAKKWAGLLKVSVQHLYRLINDATVKRERKKGPSAELVEWTKIVCIIKKRPPEEAGEISTEDAVAIAVKSGLLPERALDVSVGTYNRIARGLGYTKRQRRIVRFQAERPNQAHHFDASTSKFFYIAKRVGDDYVLKMHRPAKHYKNKPIPVDALRPWIYGLTDDHSGRHIARYVAARGESAADSMHFLTWAWEDFGLPEKLLADQGMLKKNLASAEFIERLGIELPQMMPYNKEGHGKIERPWSTFWTKFEKTFFAVNDWRKFEIPMSELNSQLTNFITGKYNEMPHRFEKSITRMQAWRRVNLHGGIVEIPENALATVAKRRGRTIGADGMLQYEGKLYEVRGLHAAKVWVFEGVFRGGLIVQDVKTGTKYEVRDFKPIPLDEYKGHKETPHQKLLKEVDSINVPQDALLYADEKQKSEKVFEMPTRTKEEREVKDPFDVTTYANLKEAWDEFFEIVPVCFKKDEREVIEQLIKDNGLKKVFVIDLAQEIRVKMEQQRAVVNG